MDKHKNINQSEWLMQPEWISDIANVSEDVAEGVALIKDVSGDIENINNSLEAQKGINETLINSVDALSDKVDKNTNDIQSTNDKVSDNSDRIFKLESETGGNVGEQISTAITDYDKTVKSSFATTNSNVASLSSSLSTLTSIVSDNKSESDKTMSEMNTGINNVSSDLVAYKESNNIVLSNIRKDVGKNKLDISELKAGNNTNNESLKSYADSVASAAATSEVSSYAITQNKRDAGQDLAIQTLSHDVASMQFDVDEAVASAKGSVKSVNGIKPDQTGNVKLDTVSEVGFKDIKGEYYENESLKTVIDSLSDNSPSDLTELKSSVTKNTNDIAKLNTSMSSNTDAIKTVSDELTVFKTSITEKVAKHTIDIGALSDVVDSNATSTNKRIDDMSTSLTSSITSEAATLTSSYSELKSDITSLESTVTSNTTAQSTLNSSMSDAINKNTSKLAELEGVIGGGVSSSEAANIVASANAYTDTKVSDAYVDINKNTTDIKALAVIQSDSVNIVNSVADESKSNAASITSLSDKTHTMSEAITNNQASNSSAITSLSATVSTNSVTASAAIKAETTQRETADNSLSAKVDAVSMSAVKSVNDVKPDANGNVTVSGGAENKPWFDVLGSNEPVLFIRIKAGQSIPQHLVTVNSKNIKNEHSVVSGNPAYIFGNIPGTWRIDLLKPTIVDERLVLDNTKIRTDDNVQFSKLMSSTISWQLNDPSLYMSIGSDINVMDVIFALRNVIRIGIGSDMQLKTPTLTNTTETATGIIGCTSRVAIEFLNANGDIVDINKLSAINTIRLDNNLLNGSWYKSDVLCQYYDPKLDTQVIKPIIPASSSIISTLNIREVNNEMVADIFTSLTMKPDYHYYPDFPNGVAPIVQPLNVRTPVKY